MNPYHENRLYDEIEQLREREHKFEMESLRLRAALLGPDPNQPEEIQPLGWLKTMIDECKLMHEKLGPDADEDPDAFWMMVAEVENFLRRARLALTTIDAKPQTEHEG